jgi:Glyoxalase-like domain
MADEDQEARELMAKMGMTDDVESDDESEDMDPEAMAEKFRREVVISPDNCLDQVILGTSDLDKAVEDFEKLTGVKPFLVTSMNGCGTKSARIAFEECAYLELIGPDAKQPETPFSKALAALPAGEMVPCHYGVRWEKSKELEVRQEWKKMGLEYDQLTMVSKDQGMPWLWDFYVFKGDGKVYFQKKLLSSINFSNSIE